MTVSRIRLRSTRARTCERIVALLTGPPPCWIAVNVLCKRTSKAACVMTLPPTRATGAVDDAVGEVVPGDPQPTSSTAANPTSAEIDRACISTSVRRRPWAAAVSRRLALAPSNRGHGSLLDSRPERGRERDRNRRHSHQNGAHPDGIEETDGAGDEPVQHGAQRLKPGEDGRVDPEKPATQGWIRIGLQQCGE